MSFIRLLAFLLVIALGTQAQAHDTLQPIAAQPDDHAPIGVMGDHTHAKGSWMLSYSYDWQHITGLRAGTSRESTDDVFAQGYMMAPTKMDMQMHMLGLMYGVTKRTSLMLMAPYNINDMDEVDNMGTRSSMHSEGWGDLQLTSLTNIWMRHNPSTGRSDHINVNLGLSIPTGSIDKRDTMMGLPNQKLPYMMQLGSGTWDPKFGITYSRQYQKWSLGLQGNATMRVGQNDQGYRRGNEYDASFWLARNLNRYFSGSLRLNGKRWDNIHGSDNELMPMMDPTNQANLQAGERVDALIGINLLKPNGWGARNRLGVEFGVPVYQRLDGPQLETDYRLTAGWQYSF